VAGSIVSLICDGGERYANTYYSDAWLADRNLDLTDQLALLSQVLVSGVWPP